MTTEDIKKEFREKFVEKNEDGDWIGVWTISDLESWIEKKIEAVQKKERMMTLIAVRVERERFQNLPSMQEEEVKEYDAKDYDSQVRNALRKQLKAEINN